jgi:hypothetical protein
MACLTLALASPARATPSAKLTYSRGHGAERCPEEPELRRSVAARLGYDLFFPWAAVTVVVEITKARARGFHARVEIVDSHGLVRGQRAIDATSEDCGDVVRAVALAISIAVDDFDIETVPPPTTSEPLPPPVATPPERSAPPPPPAPAKDRPPPARPEPRRHAPGRVSLEGSVAPIVSLGVAPTAAFGMSANLGARYRMLSLELEGRGDLPAAGNPTSNGRIDTYVLLGSVAPCVHADVTLASSLEACALFSLGTFHESGSDLQSPHTGSAPYAAAGARVGVELPLRGPVFYVAHVDGLATLTRHSVQIDGQTVFTLPPLAASVGFGAGLHF